MPLKLIRLNEVILEYNCMNHFLILLAQGNRFCEGQNHAMFEATQEITFGTTGGDEGLSPRGIQPCSSKISHSWAGPSLGVSALCWDHLLRLHTIFSPSFAEPYTALASPSTENKAEAEAVKKEMAFAL